MCDRWRTPGFGTDKHVLHIGHAKQFDLGRTQADSQEHRPSSCSP